MIIDTRIDAAAEKAFCLEFEEVMVASGHFPGEAAAFSAVPAGRYAHQVAIIAAWTQEEARTAEAAFDEADAEFQAADAAAPGAAVGPWHRQRRRKDAALHLESAAQGLAAAAKYVARSAVFLRGLPDGPEVGEARLDADRAADMVLSALGVLWEAHQGEHGD